VRNALRRRAIGAALAAVIAFGAASCVAPQQPQSANGATGFSFSGDLLGWTPQQIAHDFSDVKAMGGTWVRVPFNWVTLEPDQRGKFTWWPTDRVVYLANLIGLKVYAVVSYTPAWARPAGTNTLTPPTNVADYANFVAAAAARYAPYGIHTWEIWNEPNIYAMWAPKPNVVKYTQLLKAAYPAIHAVDPQATVLTGGTSPSADSADGTHVLPLHWLQGIYANGGKGYFDAVAHHPATYPSPATEIADWSAFQQTKDLYTEMSSQGDGNKKIWGTEIVWPTGTSPQAVSETVQGQRFAQAIPAWQAWRFTGPLFLFELRDYGTNPADPFENMGVETITGAHKAGWNTVAAAMHG
jgi:hypothetical protein